MNIQDIKNSIVLVRVCYDVPNQHNLERIEDSKETVQSLLDQGNQVIILSHWGRPDGKMVPDLSLEKLLKVVQSQFSTPVEFINQYDYFDKHLSFRDIINISKTRLFLFENTRFNDAEASNDLLKRDGLARKYAEIADYFVDEAFSVSHRQEVTNYELKKLLPSGYGISFKREIYNLNKIKSNPSRPLVVLMAGAKLETKLPLIQKMCEKADKVLIGGELCFTFLKAKEDRLDIFDSKIEYNFIPEAKKLLEIYKDKIVLPIDFLYGQKGEVKCALDLGVKSLELFKKELSAAHAIFWNGPVGYYSDPKFARGTIEIAEFITSLDHSFNVLGGGDSVAVLDKKTLDKFDFVSMGGGASLDFLAD